MLGAPITSDAILIEPDDTNISANGLSTVPNVAPFASFGTIFPPNSVAPLINKEPLKTVLPITFTEPLTFKEPVTKCLSVTILPIVTPLLNTCNSELPDANPTLNEPVNLKEPLISANPPL